MKRFKSLVLGMAMLTLAFTGCASSTTSSKVESGQTVLSHKYGETIVPENPERIVSIKLEDLIVIRDSFDQAIYDELSKIAQTPMTSLLALGEALGMADEATERLEAYGETIENAKEALKDMDEEVAMLRIMKKEIRLYPYSKNDMSKFLYEDLGLTVASMVIEYDKADSLAISMELLPDLTAEHIFLVAGYGSNTAESVKESQERYEAIKADALWQSVPAVQKGNIYEVNSRVWLTHGIIATEMKIADVLEHLTK